MKEKQTPLSPQELQALQAASVIRVVDDDAAVRDALSACLKSKVGECKPLKVLRTT